MPVTLPQPPSIEHESSSHCQQRPYKYVPYDVLEKDWHGDPRRLQLLLNGNNINPGSIVPAAADINDNADNANNGNDDSEEETTIDRYPPSTLVWVLLSKGKPKQPTQKIAQSGYNALALHKKRRNKKNKRKIQEGGVVVNNNVDDDTIPTADEAAVGGNDGIQSNNGSEKKNTNTSATTATATTTHHHHETTLNQSRKEFFLRARVISDNEPISSSSGDYDGTTTTSSSATKKQQLSGERRILVRYSKGATYRVRAYNLIPVLEPSVHNITNHQLSSSRSSQATTTTTTTVSPLPLLPPLVILVPETNIYRRLARIHTTPDDSFMEIGCDYGITVDKIQTSLEGAGDVPKVWPPVEEEEKNGSDGDDGTTTDNDEKKEKGQGWDGDRVSCLGIDRSKESIDIANGRYPKCKFALGNVLIPDEMSSIRTLCEQSLTHSAPSVICIDINGNREIDGVLECLTMVMNEKWKKQPRMIIVKSRFLYWELKGGLGWK
ncbi:hypothetical protein ACHAXR_003035, partial [Thalassiosira sp. AJA248-18]